MNLDFYIELEVVKKDFDLTRWAYPENQGFEFDRSFSKINLGDLTTSAILNNGLFARMLLVHGPFNYHGWTNVNENSVKNLHAIENAFEISNQLYNLWDWRINVPKPINLCLVKQNPMGSLHPAFVMEYIQDDFEKLGKDKKQEVMITANHMLNACIERGFNPGPLYNLDNNIIYNEFQNKVYLTGFGLWKKK